MSGCREVIGWTAGASSPVEAAEFCRNPHRLTIAVDAGIGRRTVSTCTAHVGKVVQRIVDDAIAAPYELTIVATLLGVEKPEPIGECTCVENCGEGDACGTVGASGHKHDENCTACSYAGRQHSHVDEPCPLHPESVVG